MRIPRPAWRRDDGAAVVRGWVATYTFGLPVEMRRRRRDEVAADLADEALDAIRRREQGTLVRRRVLRLVRGIPADLAWRLFDAPERARDYRVAGIWTPLSRWSLALVAVVAIGTTGALMIVTIPIVTGSAPSSTWSGWGPVGFGIGCGAVLAGILASVVWPRRGAALVIPGAVLGFVAAPMLWGCWLLTVIAVIVRWYETLPPVVPRQVDLRIRRRG